MKFRRSSFSKPRVIRPRHTIQSRREAALPTSEREERRGVSPQSQTKATDSKAVSSPSSSAWVATLRGMVRDKPVVRTVWCALLRITQVISSSLQSSTTMEELKGGCACFLCARELLYPTSLEDGEDVGELHVNHWDVCRRSGSPRGDSVML